MLKNKNELENINQSYKFLGYDSLGYKEYLVPLNEKKKEKKVINLEDGLFDDWDFEDNKTADDDVKRTPEIINDDKILTRNDFYSMEWKETQYRLYRLLVNIYSFLSDKEVAKDGNK